MKITWGLIESFYLVLVYIKYIVLEPARLFSNMIAINSLTSLPQRKIITQLNRSLASITSGSSSSTYYIKSPNFHLQY